MTHLAEPAPPSATASPAWEAFADMLEGVTVLDAGWRYVYVNPAAAAMLHVPVDAVAGRSALDVHPGLERSGILGRWSTCMETGEPQQFEAPCPLPDGTTAWIEFRVRKVPEGIFVLSLDVTERRTAADTERARRDAEARFAAAADALPGVMWTVDRELRFTSSRGSGLADLGLLPDQITGTALAAYLGVQDPGDPAILAHEAALAGASGSFSMRFEERHWACRVEPLRDADGAVTGAIGVAIDVTERMRAADEARLAWSTASIALDAASDSVGVFRTLAGADGRFEDAEIVFMNRTGRRRWLADAPLTEVAGRPLFATMPDLRSLVFELYQQVVEGNAPVRLARAVDTPDGVQVIDMTVTPFPGGFVHVGRDITEARRAQEALTASEASLRRMVEGVDAIISYRAPGSPTPTLSPQVERILGYRAEDVAPYAAWEALIHPDDRERCLAAWMAGLRQWDMEYRVRHADGHWVWLSDRGGRVAEAEGISDHGVLTDITAAREAAERLRAVMQSAADAIITIDTQGRIVDANPSASRIFLRAHDALVGSPLVDLMPEELREVHEERLRHLATDTAPGLLGREIISEAVRADGTRFPAEVSVTSWGSGESTHVTAFIRDVSDRVRAEREVELATARLRHLVDANLFGTLVAEPDGRVLEANDHWLQLTGWSREEVDAGLADWRAVTAPESLAADERAIAEIRDHGRSAPFEKTYVRRDGTRVPVLVVRTAMPGEEGAVASVVLDMTAVHDARDRLARLGAAIDQASEAVVIADLDGVITYVNPAFERVSGYARAEAVGQNPRILKSGEQDRGFYEAMWATLTSGETWRGELVNRRKDGSRYVELATISPIRGPGGAIEAYVAVKRDVTAEREAEERQRRGQRLEALGQLAGGVAHDFNNILAGIRGYGDFVRETLPEDSQAAADMDELLRAADRATSLTRQLLVFSRRQAVVPQVIDPSIVIAQAASLLRRVIGDHVVLETDLPFGQGHVLADPGQLEQAVINLAVNARDAMPDGGRLVIAVGRVPSARADGEGALRISVRDTGTGMDEATVARAFEPFFTTKAPGQGTGLGLAMVAGFVQGCGGTVSVSSEPGRGTTFALDLPVVAAEQAAGATAAIAVPGGSESILVVEDEPMAREVVRRYLAGLGYTVTVAASGQEAVEALAGASGIDLLLTDVRMPGMQGPDVARVARQLRPSVRVLFMSAFADVFTSGDAEIDRAGVLEKPFTRESLAHATREALDRR